MDTSIINLLIERTVSHLTQKLVTEINDDTKVGVLRGGNLQDNPLKGGQNILCHPSDQEWPDILNAQESNGMYAPIHEIGGGSWIRRRFKAEFQLFYRNERERDVARQSANIVKSRAEKALETMPLDIGKDSFGEAAHYIQVWDSWIDEGGGPGTFIWRGFLRFEVLTSRN